MQNGRFGTLDCSICSDTISTPFKLNCQCKFLYCYSCISKWTSNNKTCPTCRSNIYWIYLLFNIKGWILDIRL